MDLSFMDQSLEVAANNSAGAVAHGQTEPEPEPEQRFAADESIAGAGGLASVDIAQSSSTPFTQHDLSSTLLLLESAPCSVECVASSSENLDHTAYIFKIFTTNVKGKQSTIAWCQRESERPF